MPTPERPFSVASLGFDRRPVSDHYGQFSSACVIEVDENTIVALARNVNDAPSTEARYRARCALQRAITVQTVPSVRYLARSGLVASADHAMASWGAK